MADTLQLLKQTDALLEGHFELSSGRHSNRYCQCAKLLENTVAATETIGELVKKLKGVDFDVVLGPAMGGIIVAFEIARQTGSRAIFCERDANGKMALRRNFEIKKGERVLIAEDVCTTFRSGMEAVQIALEAGGEIAAIACIVDRSSTVAPYRLISATKLSIESWTAEECPLCKEGIATYKPGSRKS